MPTRIVVVHDDPEFVAMAVAALTAAGHDVLAYTDTMTSLEALEAPGPVDVLITHVAFPAGQPHGVALAGMARTKKPGVRVLFTAPPENQEHTEGLGAFLPMPVTANDVVNAVSRMRADVDPDEDSQRSAQRRSP